jgi:hypothetical protein
MKSLKKTKKTGNGAKVNLEEDFKELLEMKQNGIKLNTVSKQTFKDGRNIGDWLAHHKKKLSESQLQLLGLIAVKDKLTKYLNIRERYDKELSKEGLSDNEKALLLNNMSKIEALIKREERKQ